MGLKITVSNSDYSTPVPVIPDFLLRSNGVISYAYYHSLKNVTFKPSVSSNYEFVITNFIPGISSCKMTIPSGNSVPLHAMCIGTDVNGNAIVLYLDNSGQIRNFPKTGNPANITIINTLSIPRPSALKGVPITITHGINSFNVSYAGYSRDILYSEIPSLVTKGFGFLATDTPQSSYTIEILS